MKYSVALSGSADRFLEGLRRSNRLSHSRIVSKLEGLAEDPFSGTPLEGELRGKWATRVGDYRIIYRVSGSSVLVLVVARRQAAYPRKRYTRRKEGKRISKELMPEAYLLEDAARRQQYTFIAVALLAGILTYSLSNNNVLLTAAASLTAGYLLKSLIHGERAD